jgi:hypothetical protein
VEWRKPEQEDIYEELATIEITSDVGDETTVKEKTYEEISELEGRREKTLYDKDWDGRSDGRRWRGRSKSRCRDSNEEYVQWKGKSAVRKPEVFVGEEGWRGRVRSQDRSRGEWGGRVRSPERDIIIESRDREWRGRSPGVGFSYWG